MEKMAHETYKNIKKQKALRFERKNSFFKKESFEKIEYETYWIDSDNVYKVLFYDDQTIDKMFKRAIKELKQVELDTNEAYRNVYRNIKQKIHRWQEPYEQLKKTQGNCFRYGVFFNTALCSKSI